MPLSAVGNLGIVGSADLGSLGTREGPPVAFDWTLPSLTPLLIPCLLVVALLAFPRNRSWQAWWIWMPLGLAAVVAFFPPMLPSAAGPALDAFLALAVGLATLWLLASGSSHRFLTFARSLLIVGGFGMIALLSGQSGKSLGGQVFGEGILLLIAALATTLTLALVGWLSRGRESASRILVLAFGSMTVIWLLVAAPFIGFIVIAGDLSSQLGEMLTVVIAVAAVNYATALPFLILAWLSPFYRERLRALLHVTPGAPPMAPAPGRVA